MIIGVDPDTKSTGICLLHDDGRIEFRLAKAKGRFATDRQPQMARALYLHLGMNFPGATTLAIEWQHIRPRENRPNDIMAVQAVAGMALALAAPSCDEIHLPIPSKWRGTIPKEVVQKRILREAGIDLDSPEFSGIPGTAKSHVIDALGLCLWVKRGRKLR